eukprot:jgi/Chrzof1/9133/Cz03g37050.t1
MSALELTAKHARIRHLLTEARSSVSAGNAHVAFRYVIQALEDLGGHDAVVAALQRVLHDSPVQASASQVADLSNLFSQISIQAEQSLQSAEQAAHSALYPPLGTSQQAADMPYSYAGTSMALDTAAPPAGEEASSSQSGSHSNAAMGDPILMETGREGITECAMEDGSSFQCPTCGGVVSKSRQQQHYQHWCQPP